jgi:hypothetical protein
MLIFQESLANLTFNYYEPRKSNNRLVNKKLDFY